MPGPLNQLWRAYQQVDARNDHERLWYAKSLNQLDQLGDYRRLRLLSNRAAVPALMWVVLLATGITTIGFSFFFGTQNSSAPSAHDCCAVSDYRTGPVLDLGLKSSLCRFGSR